MRSSVRLGILGARLVPSLRSAGLAGWGGRIRFLPLGRLRCGSGCIIVRSSSGVTGVSFWRSGGRRGGGRGGGGCVGWRRGGPWLLVARQQVEGVSSVRSVRIAATSGFPAMKRSTAGACQIISEPSLWLTTLSTSATFKRRLDSAHPSGAVSLARTTVFNPMPSHWRAVSNIST